MYEFTDGMDEISGFGGSYEAGCRAMLKAGLEWWDKHPDADPQYRGFKNVYGLIVNDNEDAKALDKAIYDAVLVYDGKKIRCGDESTGAMHQAVVTTILYIRKNGWEAYHKEMCRREVS